MAADAARRWLVVARADVRLAEKALAEPDPMPAGAAYHVQQAAEKAVKAALVALGRTPPRTHDIEALAELLPADHPLRTGCLALGHLSYLNLAYRYPAADELPAPEVGEVEAWLAEVDALLTRLEALLGP